MERKAIEKEYVKKDAPLIENISQIIQGKKAVTEEELQDSEKFLTNDEK